MRNVFIKLVFIINLIILPIIVVGQGGPCNTSACSVCDVSATITSISGGVIDNNVSTINGSTGAGQTETSDTPFSITATDCGVITIDVELDFNWHQGDQINWIHGISFENSSGWLAAEGVIIPANPGWLFMNSITGVCSNTTYGAGYYWDPPGINCIDSGNLSNYDGSDCNNSNVDICEGDSPFLVDGDPSDNWGIDCETDCPQFGFSLTYCPSESGTTDEVITFVLTEDGETGGWNQSDGCIFSLSFPITINSAGVQLPDEDIGPICQDSCVTIDAGNGCDGYQWSNGETTSEVTVCPTETTTYSVTVSSDLACETSGEITVFVESCCNPDAGLLVANPTLLCPGELSTISVSNYQNDADYSQVIIIINESGIIEEVISNDSYQLESDICATFTIYSYNYLANSASTLPQVGSNISSLNCEIDCCDLIDIEVVFEDFEPPFFINPPNDITLECLDDLTPMEDQSWTDNCLGDGSSVGEEIVSATICEGGNIVRTWTVIDSCDNEVTHTQTITVLPLEEPMFIDLPINIYLDCASDIPLAIDLSYSNINIGTCLVAGSVSPVIDADTTKCGGSISYIWEYTDECGRVIDYTQVITLAPPPEPMFINAPNDVTIQCGEDVPQPIDLLATNYTFGRCQLEAMVSPIVDDQSNNCGGTITYVWEYLDECDNELSHIQIIAIEAPSEAVFVNVPADVTINCDEYNSENFSLEYDNNEIGSCKTSGTVEAVVFGEPSTCGNTIERIWTFIDDCDRTIEYVQKIIITPTSSSFFEDVPLAEIAVDCGSIPEPTLLNYSNGESGSCGISGSVLGIILGSYDVCGGSLLQTWSTADDCVNGIEFTQIINVLPSDEPNWLSVPADITLNCDEGFSAPQILEYDNGATGNCAIQGSVMASVSEQENIQEYTWTYTNPCNNVSISHTQTVTESVSPEVEVSSDYTTLDCEITSINLSAFPSIDTIGTWTGPGGFSMLDNEVVITVGGTYYFTLNTGYGCIVSDSIIIDVSNGIPIADAGSDAMLTCEVDNVNLLGSVIGAQGNYVYTWYDEMGNILGNTLSIIVDQSGSYFFEVKDLDTDCTSPRDVTVVTDKTDGPTAVIYADPGNILDCVIEFIYITNEIEQDVVYTWMIDNQPMAVSNITIDEPANIELYAIDTISGCESSSFLNITSLEEYPIINMYSDEDINCEFTEVEIVGGTPTPGDNISYTWYNANDEIVAVDTNVIYVNDPGVYYLELVDVINGCNNIDSVEVEGLFDYPIVTSTEDFMISCTQSELEINIAVDGNADDLNFHWTTVDGNIVEVSKDSMLIVSQPGLYLVEVVDEQSLCGTYDSIVVFVSEPISSSEVEVLDENCEENRDGVIILGEVDGGTAPYTFVFGGLVQSDNVIDDLSAGDYSFSVFDVNGCRFDTTVTISVIEPFAVDLESNITLQSDQITNLTVDVNIQDDEIESVQWIPSQGLSCDTCLTTSLDGTLASEIYEVIVTDIFGCSNFATVRVLVEYNTNISFPNIISANNDSENGYFSVYSDDANAQVLSMKIFDRWGEMVFAKDSFSPNIPEEGWDGTFKNRDAMQGVYVYMVEMQMTDGRKVFSGDVTVIR